MKNIHFFIWLLAFISSTVNAQITLDRDFPNQRLDIVSLEHAGPKYYQYDYAAHTGTLFNLDYSVYKTIYFAHVPCISYTVGLITETLFDTDSTTLEYVLSYTDSADAGFNIYSGDSTLLFQADSGATICANDYSIHNSIPFVPIFNTDSGTKMIVAYPTLSVPYHTSVFNLPGKLPVICCSKSISTSIASVYNKSEKTRNYPNPFIESTVIEYNLPESRGSADLFLFDESGNLINKYKLSPSQNHFEITTTGLNAGTYFYQISTSDGEVLCKKIIKVN